MTTLARKAVDWLDERVGIREAFRENATEYRVPRNINVFYSLGTVLLVLFGLQFLTGILLLAHYVPHPDQAFDSVKRIVNEVPYGWLARNLHAVGSNLAIVVLLLHMLSVIFMGSYKKPRELTWLSGFILFNLGLALCLTGYLLPWSQLSFWATTVSTEAAGSVPVIGEYLVRIARGAPTVGGATLGRFFALHVVVLPLGLLAIIGAHLMLVRRIGISRPPFGKPGEVVKKGVHEDHPDGIPFFPNYVAEEIAVVSFVLAGLFAIAVFSPEVFIPADALEPADPFNTPAHIKPEWYFLWAYQTLKIMPTEFIGLAVQGAFMTFLALLPFVDRKAERHPFRRPLFLSLFVGIIALFIGISVWGHYS